MTEPRRDRWGRYIIPDPETGEEREWTRATTLAGVLPDRYNLEKWGERMVALGLAERDDLLLLAKASDPDDKKRLDKICRDAKSAAGAGVSATYGNALHSFTEAVDNGEKVRIPAPYDADVAAYQDELKRRGITILSAEQIVLNLEVGVAGTYDRLVSVQGVELPVILDIKTGKSVDFSHLEHAVQLAIYARATHRFDTATGDVTPIEPTNQALGIIAHLPVGQARCDLYALDLETGWEAAKIARAVYELRKRKDLSRPLEVV